MDRFKAHVKEHTEFGTSYGLAHGYALREYRQNNRTERLIEKYSLVSDNITKLMSEFGDSPGDLSTVEKRTVEFCAIIHDRGLAQTISRGDLREIISQGFTSESTIEQYEELITDRLGLVEHPEISELYIPEQEGDQQRREDAESDAHQQMDVLTQAIPATDGGLSN